MYFFTVNRQKCKLLEINHQNVSKYLKSHTISADLHVIPAPGEFLIWKNQFPNVLIIRGGSAPIGPTPYPFIYYYSRKRYPFRIPSIDTWYPVHIACLELFITFNCCKCTVV